MMLGLACIYVAMAGVFWAMLANVTMEGWRSGLAALVWPLTLLVLLLEIIIQKFR